ncbi:putative acid sphingomyelinase [Jackrogersella minutella]|nr:putative acid sphingomyelinase [Jackrogersella minutella]
MRVRSFIIAALVPGWGIAVGVDSGGGSQKVLTSDMKEGPLGRLDLDALAASVREDAQSPVACAACETILIQLKLVASRGDNFFVNTLTELCKRSGVQDDDVCAGAVALEGPIIAYSLRGMRIGSRTSRLFCAALAGLCAPPKVEQQPPRGRNISFPTPEPRATRPPASGLAPPPLRVVHFSDVHVDPLYVVGASAVCGKPICCREYTDADRPGNNDSPAKSHGEHTCDSPASLEESMYAAIRAVVPDAEFSIFTGDIVDHALWDTSQTQNTLGIEDAYARMADAGLRVYGTAGNHEASPANAFPPTAAKNPSQWVYDQLSASWAPWIGPRAAASTREFGAYSVLHPSGSGDLRVISINTNLYYAQNYWLYEDPMETDPSGQLAWLVSELEAAERAGERVYVIGHMPMGARDAFHDGSNSFDRIVRRYEGTIAAMFFGHTHFDEFQISYADYANKSHENALATSYIAPSMTPMSGHPAFRVYTVDPVTFGVLDATTYIANMSDPNFEISGLKWTKYYSAKEAYWPLIEKGGGIGEELTPAFWHKVTEVFEKNLTAFEEYFERRKRGWDVGSCEGKCRSDEICKIRAGRAQENCIPPGLRVSNLREPMDGPGVAFEEEECGGSVVRDTLGSIVGDASMLRALYEMAVAEG